MIGVWDGIHELRPQPYHPRPQVECDAVGVTTSGVCPNAPVNHMPWFYYIICIWMIYWWKQHLFFYIKCELLCVNSSINTFTYTVGLDFTNRSAYEDPMDHTLCYIMWSSHNHGIKHDYFMTSHMNYYDVAHDYIVIMHHRLFISKNITRQLNIHTIYSESHVISRLLHLYSTFCRISATFFKSYLRNTKTKLCF